MFTVLIVFYIVGALAGCAVGVSVWKSVSGDEHGHDLTDCIFLVLIGPGWPILVAGSFFLLGYSLLQQAVQTLIKRSA